MTTAAEDAIRHRLLEGVLLRVSRRPDADAYVLRGGLLMRHWFRPVSRPANDLDLVVNFPFSVDETARRVFPVLAAGAGDDVIYDLDRTRCEGIWLGTDAPGVRVFTSGVADGIELDFNIDISFGPPPRPAAVFGELPTACGEPARVWMCRPAAVVGHKVQALWQRGMLGWRAKDLNDLRLLLAHTATTAAELRDPIIAYLADVGATLAGGRELFGAASWWGMKRSAARWQDFVESARGQDVPRDLAGVVAEVAGRLTPALEGSS